MELATLCGWLCYHTHDSRRSNAGFPDLVLVRAPRIVFAELKSEKGRTSPAQRLWLEALTSVQQTVDRKAAMAYGEFGGDRGPFVQVFEWRPSDWDEIEAELR